MSKPAQKATSDKLLKPFGYSGVYIKGITVEEAMKAFPKADDFRLILSPHGDIVDKSALEVISWGPDIEAEYSGITPDAFVGGVRYALDLVDNLPVLIPEDWDEHEWED